MYPRLLTLITAGVLAIGITVGISGCGDLATPTSKATIIIKKTLKSPSSFSLFSGYEVWTGKDADGNPAHIVRIEYDAQNGFGATLRDCKLVAYNDKDGDFEWRKNTAMDACAVPPLFDEAKIIETLKERNFSA